MEVINLSRRSIEMISESLLEALKEEGMVLMPAHMAHSVMILEEKRQALMKQKYVTIMQIINNKLLIHTPTKQTIVNMIQDGRIHHTEVIKKEEKNKYGRYLISTDAIRRINKMA